jgi:hypothetical protein
MKSCFFQVAQEYNGKVKFIKIDTDQNEEIASSLKVSNKPKRWLKGFTLTLLIFLRNATVEKVQFCLAYKCVRTKARAPAQNAMSVVTLLDNDGLQVYQNKTSRRSHVFLFNLFAMADLRAPNLVLLRSGQSSRQSRR